MEIYLLSSPLKDYGGSGHLCFGIATGRIAPPAKSGRITSGDRFTPTFSIKKSGTRLCGSNYPHHFRQSPQTLIRAPGFLLPGLSSVNHIGYTVSILLSRAKIL